MFSDVKSVIDLKHFTDGHFKLISFLYLGQYFSSGPPKKSEKWTNIYRGSGCDIFGFWEDTIEQEALNNFT